MNKAAFNSIVTLVIDKLEGGYYHPKMLEDGRVKDQRYKTSGETMYGIDRRNGGAINTTASGVQFWQLIDGSRASTTWPWNYTGGAIAPQLKKLAGDMIYAQYTWLSKKYLTERARLIVEADRRLLLHFIYACWNGAGWFQKFAADINEQVQAGNISPDALAQVAIHSRLSEGLTPGSKPNSLIVQTGRKISDIFGEQGGGLAAIVLPFFFGGRYILNI